MGDQLRLRPSRFTCADLDLHPLVHEHTHTVGSNANPCCNKWGEATHNAVYTLVCQNSWQVRLWQDMVSAERKGHRTEMEYADYLIPSPVSILTWIFQFRETLCPGKNLQQAQLLHLPGYTIADSRLHEMLVPQHSIQPKKTEQAISATADSFLSQAYNYFWA